jgi:hypothetical protein
MDASLSNQQIRPTNQRFTMNRYSVALAAAAAALLGAGSLMAHDGDDNDRGRGRDRAKFFVSADLIGYQEVPATSTTAKGRFHAWIDTRANTITYKLSYDALEGTVSQAHVHFAQKGVNGGISFFLCTNLGNGPAGTQACPAPPAEITGVVTADLVIGPAPAGTPPAGGGIEPGAFAEIAAAIREGVAYANVHTSKWPGGEIRGQLRD